MFDIGPGQRHPGRTTRRTSNSHTASKSTCELGSSTNPPCTRCPFGSPVVSFLLQIEQLGPHCWEALGQTFRQCNWFVPVRSVRCAIGVAAAPSTSVRRWDGLDSLINLQFAGDISLNSRNLFRNCRALELTGCVFWTSGTAML